MTPPTYFLARVGGPWPYMIGRMRQFYATLEAALRDVPIQLAGKAEAELLISTHWEVSGDAIKG